MPNSATILLAEDNRLDAELLHATFKRIGGGFNLKVVHDGGFVLKYLLGEGLYEDRGECPLPSVILLDLRMPLMDGFEVLKWKANHPEFQRIPVVVIGDCIPPDWAMRAYQYGASCVLSKTLDLHEFAEKLKTLIEGFLSVDAGKSCA